MKPSAQKLEASLQARLAQGLRGIAAPLPAEAPAQLLALLLELEKWNSAYNLTAVRDPAEMVTRHLLDSLALLPVLDELVARLPSPVCRILDAGAGAGLPAIPLAIARPQWQVTGLDSNGKKARFMRHAQRALALPNFSVIEGRVEECPPGEGHELILSRAFASLGDFFSLTRHLLAADGVWVAMKGKLEDSERTGIPPDVVLRETRRLSVPGLNEDRHAIIAIKI